MFSHRPHHDYLYNFSTSLRLCHSGSQSESLGSETEPEIINVVLTDVRSPAGISTDNNIEINAVVEIVCDKISNLVLRIQSSLTA